MAQQPEVKADPEQFARFLEATREHGCEQNTVQLDDVVRRVAKLPPPRKAPPKVERRKKVGADG
jgi:hypothetical protein